MDISFDEQTKNELLLLKGNIEGLLKMNRRGLWVHGKNVYSTEEITEDETIQCSYYCYNYIFLILINVFNINISLIINVLICSIQIKKK